MLKKMAVTLLTAAFSFAAVGIAACGEGSKSGGTDGINKELFYPETLKLVYTDNIGVRMETYAENDALLESCIDSLDLGDLEQRLNEFKYDNGVYSFTMQDYVYRIGGDSLSVLYCGDKIFGYTATDGQKVIEYTYSDVRLKYHEIYGERVSVRFTANDDIYILEDWGEGYSIESNYLLNCGYTQTKEIYSSTGAFTGLVCTRGDTEFYAYAFDFVNIELKFREDRGYIADSEGNAYEIFSYDEDGDIIYETFEYGDNGNAETVWFIVVNENYSFPTALQPIEL